jgi:hypothetical protein
MGIAHSGFNDFPPWCDHFSNPPAGAELNEKAGMIIEHLRLFYRAIVR